MDDREVSLYEELMAFDIDGGELALTFAGRLARENSWSVPFAERVIVEYKRFVYLAMTADHMVTPSVAVDEAWHLHLTYTKSYWERMCREILGKPLHHNPTEGGKSEQAKFLDLYNRTLATYRDVFGEDAPGDIWPVADVRFSEREQPVKVVPSGYWVIRKNRFFFGSRVATVSLVAVMVFSGCAWMFESTEEGAKLSGDVFLAVFVFVGILVLLRLLKGGGRGGGGGGWWGCGGSGCGAGCGSGCGGGCGGCGG